MFVSMFVFLAVTVVGCELTVYFVALNMRHQWFEVILSMQYSTVGRNTNAVGSGGSRCLGSGSGSGSLNRLHLIDVEVLTRARIQEQVVWTYI